MHSTTPPRPGGPSEPDAGWGIRRAVRLAFPDPASLAHDESHTARLDVYLTDLLQPYGLALKPGKLEPEGQSYGEMAEALIELAVPAAEAVDLLVLAYAIPDIAPGRATTTYLSHVCPGQPMAFAVSDQGSVAAFTGLRLIREYAASAGLRRALLLIVEQGTLPYDPGVPVAVPAGHTGVALLFGDAPSSSLPSSASPADSEVSDRIARLGPVAIRGGAAAPPLVDEAGLLATADAVILGAVLEAEATLLIDADRVHLASSGQPYTGVWWELAGELVGGAATSPTETPGRRLVLADSDPALGFLGLAAIDVDPRPAAAAGAVAEAESAAALPIVCVEDYRALARDRVDADVWDFIEGGAERERTLAANRRAFGQVSLRPRVLVDVSECDTHTAILDAPVSTPLGIAPTAYHKLLHPDGEVATAHGASAAGALYVVSVFASRTLEEIASAASGPLWLQLYWLRRREVMADLICRAAESGYRALMLTVDVPRLGRRLRDVRNGFAVGPESAAVNLDPALMASAHQREVGTSALAVHAAQAFDASVTWSDLEWLRAQSDLPLVLKGILTAEDAALAVEHGAAAIVVSNHGGRQLDGAGASLRALAEVADAVGGACPVLFDGGVRGGTDAFTALALGADAVLLGRPVLWGLAAAGADGVAGVLDLATEELAHTMALAGRPSLADIDRTAARWSN